jgi:hypothetical protein
MRRLLVAVAALAVLGAVAPSAEAAKTYRFKVSMTVHQVVGWNQHYRENEWCGQDYHREFKGLGSGDLSARLTGGRISFKAQGGRLVSTEFRVPATRGALSDWEVYWAGVPENCPPGLPPAGDQAIDTSDCGIPVKGRLRGQLFVQRGRLALFGAFDPAGEPDPIGCPDPSGISVAASAAGPATRRDVDDLIRSKRVRSIELGASVKNKKLTVKELGAPAEGTDLISAGGDYDARWKIKLTRIYR